MKAFYQYLNDSADTEIETLLSKSRRLMKKRRDKEITDDELYEYLTLDEVSIKPTTARVVALALISKLLNRRTKVKQEEDLANKINHLADLNADVSYLLLLVIATEQNDPRLLRKIPKR
jgi:glutamine cyclotransferase